MKNTNADFEKTLESFSDDIKILARKTRQLIYSILPNVVEVVWVQQKNTGYGTGPKKNTEHFCWIMPASKHITLGFNYGAELPDPHQLLEGTGKLFRHVKIKSQEQLSDKHLISLIIFASGYRVPKIK